MTFGVLSPKKLDGLKRPQPVSRNMGCASRGTGMTRAQKSEKRSGISRASEADWSRQINDFLTWRGWKAIRTPATRIRYPSGRYGWIFEEGHADWLCLRPIEPGTVEMFYREDKKPGGVTAKERKAKQDAWAERMRNAGYLVCSIPEDVPDPFLWFCDWYRGSFSERRGK